MNPNGPWRVGRQVGRTIYDGNDRLIGVMDRIEDARLVVEQAEAVALLRRYADGEDILNAAIALLARIGEVP